MDTRLLLIKRLVLEANQFSFRVDSISSGIAISMLQDAVELYIWALIGRHSLNVKDISSFTANLKIVESANIEMPYKSRLFDLNKARVNFKHYGNLPAPEEAERHSGFVEEFLRTAMPAHFGIDYDSLSLADLIVDDEIKELLSLAKVAIENSEGQGAVVELAKAKLCILAKLGSYIPPVDSALEHFEFNVRNPIGSGSSWQFQYIARYMGMLRESILLTLLKMPAPDYQLLNTFLPTAVRTHGGRWQVNLSRSQYPIETCKRSYAILVAIALKVESEIEKQ